MKSVLLSLLCGLLSMPLSAQSVHPWENLFEQLTTSDDIDRTSWEDTYELLCDLEQHPVNINTATREDLERIPFLTEQQIEDLQAYVYQYGGMRSLGELSMIESIDAERQQLLTYCLYIGKQENKAFPSLATIAKYGKQEVLATAKIPFYTRKGDENGYLGYRYRHDVRYAFSYADYLKIGLIGAQDAGEPFFSGGNKWGYDHYSFYVALRKLGRLKAAVVGRYRLRLGMGLVMNNSFGYGKLSMLSTLGRSDNDVRGYSGRSNARYLQGAATTIQLSKRIDLTTFVSWRKIDATLTKDQTAIKTLLTTGYHRTPSEMERKNNASQSLAGGRLRWNKDGFRLGLTGLYTVFDKPLQPDDTQKYRAYYPHGKHFWNVGADYGYQHPRWSFNGETALNNNHAVATLNALSFQATGKLSLLALYRFYSYRYYSLFSEAFSDGGSVQNESGLYVGADWHPVRNLSVAAYTDIAYSPWMKYRISGSSHSWDNLLSVVYSKGPFTLTGRYRLRIRQKDNAGKDALANEITQRCRWSAGYTARQWSGKVQADFCHYQFDGQTSSGWMVSGNGGWKPLVWLQLSSWIAYFHTDDYNSRVYTYERGMLYSFSFPAYYGKGVRYALWAKAQVNKHLSLTAKIGTTDYLDRDHISSGLQEIQQSAMTDLEMQLKWNF